MEDRPSASRAVTFRTLDHTTCVTAIKCLDADSILAGAGGHVSLLRRSTGHWNCLWKLKVFSSQSVHGLLPRDSNLVAVFGGRHFSLLDLTPSPRVTVERLVSDWIVDLKWLDCGVKLVLLTAHNRLVEVDSTTGDTGRTVVCPDRSLLYCGSILHSAWHSLVVLAGTVHNQVLVWTTPPLPHHDAHVLATLSAHKGVIFSVTYDAGSSTIASTSDDRTARLWKVTLGDGASVKSRWTGAQFSLQVSLFGHKARVFQSAFLPSPNASLATIGEDGGLMVWNVKGDCVGQHWMESRLLCLDYLRECGSGSDVVLAAGSSEGSVCLFPQPESDSSCPSDPLPVALDEAGGRVRQVRLTAGGALLVYCDGGCIFKLSGLQWTRAYSSEDIRSYCVLAMSPCRNRIAVASISGCISVFSVIESGVKLLTRERPSDGRVYSLHWLDPQHILACFPRGRLCLLHCVSDSVVTVVCWLSMVEARERWMTCGAMVSPGRFVCGDRQGSLYLYSFHSQQPQVGVEEGALFSVKQVHSGGVTCVTVAGDAVMSCGRDGTVRKYAVVRGEMHPVLSHKLPADWASHILYSKSFGHLVVAFHSVHLCVWSVAEGRLLMRTKCWGGHRSWDLHLDQSETLSVVFIKEKCVHRLVSALHSVARPLALRGHHGKAVNAGLVCDAWLISGGEDCSVRVCTVEGLHPVCCAVGHLSSVRCLSLLQLPSHLEHSRALLISAGGRAQLKLWNLYSSGELCELLSHMLRPDSSLSTVAAADCPEVRYMSVCCLSTSQLLHRIYAAASDGVLRVLRLDVERRLLELEQSDDSSAGRCLLQVACLQHSAGSLCVTSATDGSIVFRLQTASAGLQSIASIQLHSTGVNSLSVSSLCSTAADVLLVTGGDDSVLALSLVTVTTRSVTLKHSVRFNSLHTCQITGVEVAGGRYVVSAGLDGRVCLVGYSVTEDRLQCHHLATHTSSIHDIHGLSVHRVTGESLVVCVFGIGMERIEIIIPSTDPVTSDQSKLTGSQHRI